MTDTDDDMAATIIIMTNALRTILDQSADTMDKGDVIGAGRRLERISIAAQAALAARGREFGAS